jgi:hypothetical protein
VIVGVSQTFAEMFSRFTYLHNLLGVKQVQLLEKGSKIKQSVLLFLRSNVMLAILFCVVQNKFVCKAIHGFFGIV